VAFGLGQLLVTSSNLNDINHLVPVMILTADSERVRGLVESSGSRI